MHWLTFISIYVRLAYFKVRIEMVWYLRKLPEMVSLVRKKDENINDCHGEFKLYKNSKRTIQWTLYHLYVMIITKLGTTKSLQFILIIDIVINIFIQFAQNKGNIYQFHFDICTFINTLKSFSWRKFWNHTFVHPTFHAYCDDEWTPL